MAPKPLQTKINAKVKALNSVNLSTRPIKTRYFHSFGQTHFHFRVLMLQATTLATSKTIGINTRIYKMISGYLKRSGDELSTQNENILSWKDWICKSKGWFEPFVGVTTHLGREEPTDTAKEASKDQEKWKMTRVTCAQIIER